jgi:hypothetical protein
VLWWRSDLAKVFNGSYTAVIVSPNDWALHGKIVTFHLVDFQAEETSIYNGQVLKTETLNLTFPSLLPPSDD